MQAGTGSTTPSPYVYCPQPGAEPPWLTEAKKYREANRYMRARGDTDGANPTNETTTNGQTQIRCWVRTVKPEEADGFKPMTQGWCAAFLGAVLEKCGLAHTSNLAANSYIDLKEPDKEWGQDCGEVVGAIAVYENHVGIVTKTGAMLGRERGDIIGGNQSGAVNILPQSEFKAFLGYRWPKECPCPGEASESGEANE